MNYFDIGILILFGATAIFYVVYFSLVYYWHEKDATYVVVPIYYTFLFFLVGFLLVCAVTLSIQYLPAVIEYLKQQ